MSGRLDSKNVGVRNGDWGERVAAEVLRRGGYEIIERNARPVASDLRYEIDIVAWERSSDTMVFFEVKQHSSLSPFARRLRSVDRRKMEKLRRACNAWRRANKWRGGYRFDVIEVYGSPESGRPVVDHIDRVALFAKGGRFVKWK